MMFKRSVLAVCCGLLIALAGCSAAKPIETPSSAPSAVPTEEAVSTPELTEEQEPTRDPSQIPTEEEVTAARERALEGMSDEDADWLFTVIVGADGWWEGEYLQEGQNIFSRLADPDDLYWNYFDHTGDIQIGWALDGDVDRDEVCAQEGLTDEQFYEKFGTPVATDNDYDADAFIAILEDIRDTVQNEDLTAALDRLIELTDMAHQTHQLVYANDLYKMLHDLDYFLMRYGPTDVGPQVDDNSTVTRYYGTLDFYA